MLPFAVKTWITLNPIKRKLNEAQGPGTEIVILAGAWSEAGVFKLLGTDRALCDRLENIRSPDRHIFLVPPFPSQHVFGAAPRRSFIGIPKKVCGLGISLYAKLKSPATIKFVNALWILESSAGGRSGLNGFLALG